jgi:hypothetical protein
MELSKNIKNENFQDIQKDIKIILTSIKNTDLNKDEKNKIQALKYIKV